MAPFATNCPNLLASGGNFWRVRDLLFCVFCFLASAFPTLAQSGSVDPAFNPGDGVDLPVYTILPQGNGQIFIGGAFTTYDNLERVNVAHLNADGSRDDTFNASGAFGGGFPSVNALALQQPSGKLLVGGSFTNSAATNLCRLLGNGNLDSTFNVLVDDTVNAIVQQTDGSIVLGGFFAHVNGQSRSGIARTDNGGTLDSTFNPTVSGGFATIYALALQSDGRILIAGSFTNVNGNGRTNIARLNPDGSVDTGFKGASVGGGQLTSPAFYAVAVDAQGRVTVGGDFTSVNGQVRTNLARFNSDGSSDTSFSAVAGTDYAVNSVVLETYGKILIGGFFNTVNGRTNDYVARLHSDGTLDGSFNTGSGPDDVVYALALQGDGKVLVGGAFVDINGFYLSGIGRLLNVQTVSPPRLMNPSLSNGVFRASVATYSGKSYVLESQDALSGTNWTARPAVAGDGTTKTLSDTSATVSKRFYRVEVQ